MFEVRIYKEGNLLTVETCDVGDLLPAIASLLQRYEGGGWQYQTNYTVRWCRVKE